MSDSYDDNKIIVKRGAEIPEKENDKTSEVCEICGGKMERDPESGEFYCPDCYYSENQ